MPLLLFLVIILILQLKKNPELSKIYSLAIIAHLFLLVVLCVYLHPPIKGVAYEDGDVFSQNAGIMSLILRGVEFGPISVFEKIGSRGYYPADFFRGIIPPPVYGIGFIGYVYSIFYAAYGYAPTQILILNTLLNLLTGIIIYKLGQKLFNQKVAFIAVTLYLFNPIAFYYSTTKAKDTLSAFIFYLLIYLTILLVKEKRAVYFLLIIPLLIFAKLLMEFYFKPILLFLAVYFSLSFFRKWLIATAIFLLSFLSFAHIGFIKEKIVEIFTTGSGIHYYQTISGGQNYNLLIFGPNMLEYSVIQKVIYFVNSWYHLIFEPILSRNISVSLFFYYPFKIIWVLMSILGVLGIISSFRYNDKGRRENLLLLLFLFGIGSILAMSSGNVGTMLRHRSIIDPVIIIYASFFISTKLTVTAPSVVNNHTSSS